MRESTTCLGRTIVLTLRFPQKWEGARRRAIGGDRIFKARGLSRADVGNRRELRCCGATALKSSSRFRLTYVQSKCSSPGRWSKCSWPKHMNTARRRCSRYLSKEWQGQNIDFGCGAVGAGVLTWFGYSGFIVRENEKGKGKVRKDWCGRE